MWSTSQIWPGWIFDWQDWQCPFVLWKRERRVLGLRRGLGMAWHHCLGFWVRMRCLSFFTLFAALFLFFSFFRSFDLIWRVKMLILVISCRFCLSFWTSIFVRSRIFVRLVFASHVWAGLFLTFMAWPGFDKILIRDQGRFAFSQNCFVLQFFRFFSPLSRFYAVDRGDIGPSIAWSAGVPSVFWEAVF